MKKNILVVDDSALMRRVICDIINSDDEFQAVDVCKDGLEAYEKLKVRTYDGVVLDVIMPRLDGIGLLQKLKDDNIKATVLIVSTAATKEADVTIQALELGAVDFITKPGNIIEAKGEAFKKQLLSVLSEVLRTKSDNRRPGSAAAAAEAAARRNRAAAGGTTAGAGSSGAAVSHAQAAGMPLAPGAVPGLTRRLKTSGGNRLVALACSTGGPKALQSVIPLLPKNIDAPVVLVQHMPTGFTKSMAERLDSTSKVRVKEAEDGERLEKGCVYVAPGGRHLEVRRNADGTHKIYLNNELPAIGGLKPCANIMYDSLVNTGYDEIVCVVLTGMGADGTNGIVSLGRKKPIYVIAQNAQTCVVYGMPKAIAESGVVDQVVPLDEVANTITKKVGVN